MLFQSHTSRRATTRIEAIAFIVLFCLAALAAWALWREPIKATNQKLVERTKSLISS